MQLSDGTVASEHRGQSHSQAGQGQQQGHCRSAPTALTQGEVAGAFGLHLLLLELIKALINQRLHLRFFVFRLGLSRDLPGLLQLACSISINLGSWLSCRACSNSERF